MAVETQRYVVPAEESDPRRMMGCLFDWKAQAATTGGALSFVEIDGWRGCEPPLHYHTREDELFYLLEGEATFKVGDVVRRIGPGGFVWAPRDVVHGFAFETERVRMLVGLLPGGSEAVFHAVSTPDPERRPPAPPPESELLDLAEVERHDNEYGVFYVGPPLRELLATEGADDGAEAQYSTRTR